MAVSVIQTTLVSLEAEVAAALTETKPQIHSLVLARLAAAAAALAEAIITLKPTLKYLGLAGVEEGVLFALFGAQVAPSHQQTQVM